MLHGNDISTVHPGAFYSLRSLQVGVESWPGQAAAQVILTLLINTDTRHTDNIRAYNNLEKY